MSFLSFLALYTYYTHRSVLCISRFGKYNSAIKINMSAHARTQKSGGLLKCTHTASILQREKKRSLNKKHHPYHHLVLLLEWTKAGASLGCIKKKRVGGEVPWAIFGPKIPPPPPPKKRLPRMEFMAPFGPGISLPKMGAHYCPSYCLDWAFRLKKVLHRLPPRLFGVPLFPSSPFRRWMDASCRRTSRKEEEEEEEEERRRRRRRRKGELSF